MLDQRQVSEVQKELTQNLARLHLAVIEVGELADLSLDATDDLLTSVRRTFRTVGDYNDEALAALHRHLLQ